MLVIEVVKIEGECPVHNVGDKIVMDGPKIDLKRTDNVCIHALSSILHYVVALREGVDPRKLGLSKDSRYAYIQCLDPGEPYTDGGTVVFRCLRGKDRKECVKRNEKATERIVEVSKEGI